MGKILRGALLATFILLLIILVPSPSLGEALDPASVTPIPIDAPKAYPVHDENYISDTEYRDSTLHITIERDQYLDTEVWIARVKLAHPSQLRTAMSGGFGGKERATVPILANRNNAVLAINGDYYGFINHGVVLRQGHMYRNRPIDRYDVLLIDDQGDFHPVLGASADAFHPVYESLGGAWDEGGHVVNILTFGPVLIQDGRLAYEKIDSKESGGDKLAQRMVLAQDGPLSYLCICTEGPESGSRGLTLDELAAYIVELGCQTAYNLDGGSSATLAFHGKKINSIASNKTRALTDIIYFASAIPSEED